MNYTQTLDYLYSRLPMYQRIGAAAYKADLNNTIALCEILGNPEGHFQSIHIAGTNGKGSTSHLLAAILQSAGYKVGLYTSPHLKDFRERVKINGEMISEKEVVGFVEQLIPHLEEQKLDLSFFEMTVGLAFYYFAKENVDIAIIETGLGGRLDSTNVITPLLSIITNISYDHMALLGNTLPLIAAEKAGIIKPSVPIIIGESQPETNTVFLEKAYETKSSIVFADKMFEARNAQHTTDKGFALLMDFTRKGNTVYPALQCALAGNYQQKNIATVLCATEELKRQGFFITETNIRNGMKNVVKTTGLLGRWQVLGTKPLTITDTGHNEGGLRLVLQQIENTPHQQLHFVLGVVNDKDISTILHLLPRTATYYFCKANIPRGLEATHLKHQANDAGLQGEAYVSVRLALAAAKENAKDDDLIFIGGSTFTVAEIV